MLMHSFFQQLTMNIPITNISPDIDGSVLCSTCQASCCQLEVMLITETGVPARYIQQNDEGVDTMLRLDDGWCAALDRQTKLCTIYENRPLICREFEMGSYECKTQRASDEQSQRK